ncbi:MAG: ATP-binding protein [Sporomusaceae bacterium]|nr:ATP-binding protein [Sporomusaceae bacterium]
MFRLGIRTRLIFAFFIMIFLSLFLTGSYVLWYFYNHDLNALKATMQVECQIIEELLHDELSDALRRNNIDNKVKDLGSKIKMRITVIDQQGAPLADSSANPVLMENHLNRPEVQSALSGAAGMSIRFSDTTEENLLYMAIPVYNDRELIAAIRIATSLSHIEEGFQKIRNAMLAAFFFAFLLAIALSLRLARKYTEPLEEIAETAREIADGKLEARVYLKTGDELEVLAHAINHLTSNLEDKITETIAEKNKLELILEHMDNGVIMFDKYGKVVSANKMATLNFSITEKMIGQHNMNVIGKSQLDKALQKSISSGENQIIDLKRQSDVSRQIYQVSLVPIQENHQDITAVLAVFHDITALQELNDRQADFVANASHELATPLTAIKGFAETLLDGAMESPSLRQKFLTIIFNESERMTRLIKDLLQLARLNRQPDQPKTVSDPVALSPILKSTAENLLPYWQDKKIDFTVTLPPHPIFVTASADWIKQIVTNLLENSAKYTPEGGKVYLTCSEQGKSAIITVKDTGIGIPAKDLPYIFDRFYRVDRARARTAGGTGLGLSIVKMIVEMIGGTITVTSEIDKGTTFTVTIPTAIHFG